MAVSRSGSFFEQVRRKADPIWNAVFEHPFVTGIGDGTLPLETFRGYLGQDFTYILNYAKVKALALTKAEDLETMRVFADGVNFILNGEAVFHRTAAEHFGVTLAELARTEMAPTNRAYVDYLLRVGHQGSPGEIVAAMLPCHHGYCEIGQRLAARGLPGHPLYDLWIQTYAGEEIWLKALWNRDYLDRWAASASDEERERAERHFLTGSRYEWMFFDMGWQGQAWPV